MEFDGINYQKHDFYLAQFAYPGFNYVILWPQMQTYIKVQSQPLSQPSLSLYYNWSQQGLMLKFTLKQTNIKSKSSSIIYYIGPDVHHNQLIVMSWKVTATWTIYHQTIQIPLSSDTFQVLQL